MRVPCGEQETLMSDFDEKDPVWDLLGKASRKEASPWFADRVMNNLPETAQNRWSVARWFSQWAPVGAVCLVFTLGMISLVSTPREAPATVLQAAVEFEIIRDLDRYLSEVDSNAWTQNSQSSSAWP
jgi:hypothetical protein